MGFTELMSSGRGPGVIGTLIALVVLGGFGVLSIFVFDEGLQGGEKKIEAVIRDQALLIESNRSAAEDYRKRIAKLDDLKSVGKQADEMKSKVENLAAKSAGLTAAKEEAAAAVAAATADWEKYKDEYRASEWAAAVGEDLGELKSLSGRVYSQVKIRKVDHTGMQITDATGPKAISSDELPLELQDRFQFDVEKTVVDCFRYRHRIGLDVALEAIREYLRRPRRNIERLLRYAEVDGVRRTIQPYLEAMV